MRNFLPKIVNCQNQPNYPTSLPWSHYSENCQELSYTLKLKFHRKLQLFQSFKQMRGFANWKLSTSSHVTPFILSDFEHIWNWNLSFLQHLLAARIIQVNTIENGIEISKFRQSWNPLNANFLNILITVQFSLEDKEIVRILRFCVATLVHKMIADSSNPRLDKGRFNVRYFDIIIFHSTCILYALKLEEILLLPLISFLTPAAFLFLLTYVGYILEMWKLDKHKKIHWIFMFHC